MIKRAAAVLLVTLAAACATPPAPTPPPGPAPEAPAAAPPPPTLPPAPPPAPAPAVPVESPMQSFERMRGGLTSTRVYFDFNKSVIRPDQNAAIMDNARLASAFSNDYVTLQGKCDGRGSREYNLALGQRRANAVKRRLVQLGVPASHIETVSFGREKPRAQCRNETCWRDSRRADVVHTWKETSSR
jgi:peptidoglycan-associated lipoprotein